MTTYSPKAGEVQRNWYVIDAEDIVLGRLATTAANLLRGCLLYTSPSPRD